MGPGIEILPDAGVVSVGDEWGEGKGNIWAARQHRPTGMKKGSIHRMVRFLVSWPVAANRGRGGGPRGAASVAAGSRWRFGKRPAASAG